MKGCSPICDRGIDKGEDRAAAESHHKNGRTEIGPFPEVMNGQRPNAGIDHRVGNAHEHEAPYGYPRRQNKDQYREDKYDGSHHFEHVLLADVSRNQEDSYELSH